MTIVSEGRSYETENFKSAMSNQTIIVNRNLSDQMDLWNYFLKVPPEPAICKEFGCGKHLTREEQLCGDHCSKHAKKVDVDIMLIIKME